jgi:hypothetical protein
MGAEGLLLAVALALSPQQEKKHVVVTASSPWPSSVSRGYAPVHVELTNLDERPLEVELEFKHEGMKRQVSLHGWAKLRPLANESFDFTVPLLGVALSDLRLHVTAASDRSIVPVGGVARDRAQRQILFVPDDPDVTRASGGSTNEWCVALKTAVDAETPAQPNPRGHSFVGASIGGSGPSGMTIVRGSAMFTFKNVAAVGVPADALPIDAACYTSVDAVAIDLDRAPLRPEAQDALLAWVRMGGRLALFSDSWQELPRRLPGVAEWQEPRFQLNSGPLWSVTRHGAGRILCASRECPANESFGHVFYELVSADDWSVPLRAETSSMAWPSFAKIPDVGAIPRRTAMAALLLFVFVIGPVNAVFVRRMRRPTLGLVTIPAIALVATLLFVAYGIFRQGLDVKSASLSLSLLDQRQRRATTIELRELFAGLDPGGGLRPAAGTLVSPFPSQEPLEEGRPVGVGLRDESDTEDFLIEGSSSPRLYRSFLPPRVESRQVLLADAAARQRLALHRKGDRLVVENGLGVAIEKILLCDDQGNLHAAAGCPAGGEVELEPQADPISRESHNDLGLAVHDALPGSDGLPPGSFAARVARSPFADATGLELHEVRGAHFIVGILDLAPEAWR